MAKDELFVFAQEMEDLEQAAARLFDDGGAGRAVVAVGRHRGGGAGAQRGESGLKARHEILMAFEQGLVGRPLVLFEEAVFLERELVELVADLQVFAKGIRHEARLGKNQDVEAGGLAEGAGSEGTSPGREKSIRRFSAESSQSRCWRRQETIEEMSPRMDG